MGRSEPRDPGIRGVLLLAFGVAGFAMSVTLLYLGMRDIMDIGGFCAEGGPYVIEQHCPEGVAVVFPLGMLGLFLFGGIAIAGGALVGGYGWLPIAGWTALFAVLGWNFLLYGLVDPPDGEIQWGWLVPGVVFELMAWVPAAVLVIGAWGTRGAGGSSAGGPAGPAPVTLPGPSQPLRADTATRSSGTAVSSEPRGPAELAAMAGIASAMDAVIEQAAADTPVDPRLRAEVGDPDASVGPVPGQAFSEGTQALLDRLERLADMRDRGLLAADEFETAKDAILRELEARE